MKTMRAVHVQRETLRALEGVLDDVRKKICDAGGLLRDIKIADAHPTHTDFRAVVVYEHEDDLRLGLAIS